MNIETLKKEMETAKALLAETEQRYNLALESLWKAGTYLRQKYPNGAYCVLANDREADHEYIKIRLSTTNPEIITVVADIYRKATKEEIVQYLLSEAAKAGWVVGGTFIDTYMVSSPKRTVKELVVVVDDADKKTYSVESGRVSDKLRLNKTPFVVVKCDGGFCVPISECAMVVQLLPVINNYQGEYHKHASYVKYGCALISIAMLRHLAITFTIPHNSNRRVREVVLDSNVIITDVQIVEILAAVDKINAS